MRILSILTILMLGATAGAATPADWRQEDQEWREARLTRLRSPDGWLTLVGLHWIEAAPRRFTSCSPPNWPSNCRPAPQGGSPSAGDVRPGPARAAPQNVRRTPSW